jgi:hypothetical protein
MIAIRADLACHSALQDKLGLFSNWQKRMQQIRSLEKYAEKSTNLLGTNLLLSF